jgi:two-component system phosphate regulon response regulator PhoB
MPTVVIVEENADLGSMLEASYKEEGYIAGVCDLDQHTKHIVERQPDLVVLHSELPISVLPQTLGKIRMLTLREQPAILALGEGDRFRLMIDAGADDYLPKPFSVQRLLARSRALIERSAARPLRILTHREISMNLDTHRVTLRGREVHLGPTEYRILTALLNEPDHLFSRREILQLVWSDAGRDERMVDVGIKKLRGKLNIGSPKDAIRTVRGVGYGLS